MFAPNQPMATDINYPDGWTPWGFMADFNVRTQESSSGKSIIADWEITSPNKQPNGWAIYIFQNGTFLEKTTALTWTFPFSLDRARYNFDFYIGPRNTNVLKHVHWSRQLMILRRVTLTWDLDADITQVAVYKNTVNLSAINNSEGQEVEGSIETTPNITVTGSGKDNITVQGKWAGDSVYDSITFNIVDGGTVGTSRYTWTYNGETSDPIATHSGFAFTINGVQIKFAAGTYAVDGTDDFTVKVSLPTTFTTGNLENGTHRFQVASWRGDFRSLSDEIEEINVQAIPGTAQLLSYDYTDGTGEARCVWQMPAETGVRAAEIFRNYPANGYKDIHWRPIYRTAVGPSYILDYTVTGLQEGRNKICVDVLNNGERNRNRLPKGANDSNPLVEIVLDSSLNEYSNPSPPWAIKAEVQGDFTVTLTISADDDSDSFEVYHDNGTGTVDYGTVWATVTNPKVNQDHLQQITSTGHYLPDGDYIIAARAKSGSVVETNTNIIYPLTVDTSSPTKATNLSATLVA